MEKLQPIINDLKQLAGILESSAGILEFGSSSNNDHIQLTVDALRKATIQLNGTYYSLHDLFTNLKYNR